MTPRLVPVGFGVFSQCDDDGEFYLQETFPTEADAIAEAVCYVAEDRASSHEVFGLLDARPLEPGDPVMTADGIGIALKHDAISESWTVRHVDAPVVSYRTEEIIRLYAVHR